MEKKIHNKKPRGMEWNEKGKPKQNDSRTTTIATAITTKRK